MDNTITADPNARQPLRLWPGVVLLILMLLTRFVVPAIFPAAQAYGFIGGIVCALAILAWWLFLSRAPWSERLGALALMIVAVFATSLIVHESIAGGMMGMMLPIFALQILPPILVIWAVASRNLSRMPRQATLVAAILLACAAFTLVRTGGLTGDGEPQWHWRWTQTPEQQLLAQAVQDPVPPAAAVPTPEATPAAAAEVEQPAPTPSPTEEKITVQPPAAAAVERRAFWPGYRGAGRDDVVRGVKIETDWAKSPPVELWRRPIGPGWSSFAVQGDLVYTQEQRGEDEIVACYNLTTGQPVWRHRDKARFWESNAGAGPRGTPTLSNGRVFSFGATGILNALDAGTGKALWTRNAASDTEIKVPGWGFASSPLVVGDMVVVATSGRLAAYDAATGKPRWIGPPGGSGDYSSPHLVTINGVPQILLLQGGGALSVSPADGKLLWEHKWESGSGIVQPALAGNGDILITASDAMGGIGIRRIGVARESAGWTIAERWTSRGLKPYFNDFVVHKGHAFGFDGRILSCIDLSDGERKWKGGRFGHGQMLLMSDQDLLLVLSEEGELVLVGATQDKFSEIARFKALEGKTWNHPVVVGDLLLARNGAEMAAFRLPVAGR